MPQTTKYLYMYIEHHSVFSPRRHWDSHNPSPASECAPPRTKGWGVHSPRLRLRGWGIPNSDDCRKSLALCLLCAPNQHKDDDIPILLLIKGSANHCWVNLDFALFACKPTIQVWRKWKWNELWEAKTKIKDRRSENSKRKELSKKLQFK